MIVGIGIDLIEEERFARALASVGERLEARLFTDAERRAAAGVPDRTSRLAGLFAAKEAALKALGTGWGEGIAWRDLEIAAPPGEAPRLSFNGRARELAGRVGASRIFLSLAVDGGEACALVVLESEE